MCKRIEKFVTPITGVVQKNNFMEQIGRGSIDDRMNSAKQRGPSLVRENNDHTRGWEILIEFLLFTSEKCYNFRKVDKNAENVLIKRQINF